MNKLLISIIVTAILVGAGAFFGGAQYAESKIKRGAARTGALQDQRMGGAGRFNGGQRAAAGLLAGEIMAQDDTSITLKTRDGGSKIVLVSSSTEIVKSVAGSKDDLANGKTVSVVGDANKDGSITATSIQLRNALPIQGKKE